MSIRSRIGESLRRHRAAALLIAGVVLSASIGLAAYKGIFIEALDLIRDGDADQDGMPTRWEFRHSLDPLVNDAYEDYDGDVMFNIDEYRLGLLPDHVDTDGDHVVDGQDRAPRNVTALPLNTMFAAGVLSFNISLNNMLLACNAHSAGVAASKLNDRGSTECKQSPTANDLQTYKLHELSDSRWAYSGDIRGGSVTTHTGDSKWYTGEVGPTKYAIEYWPNTQTYFDDIRNVAPVPLNDTSGQSFVNAVHGFTIPQNPPEHITIEIQGYSPLDSGVMSFDARIFEGDVDELRRTEDRRILTTTPLGLGGYRAEMRLANLSAGKHTLFLMPLGVVENEPAHAPPEEFRIHSILERYVTGIEFATTTSDSSLWDGPPPGAERLEGLDERQFATSAARIDGTLSDVKTIATVVESFAVLGVIPDASIRVDAKLGSLASSRLASARTVFMTHQEGGDFRVTTHTTILLYYGEPVPLTWGRSWGTRRSLDKARSEGKLIPRNRFLRDGITDVQRALKSRPWKNDLNTAMFRHAVLLCLLAGPRGSEPAGLRVADVRRERQVIENWFQRKKSSSRDVVIPERWFWRGPANSVDDYLATTRPALIGERDDPGTYFVNSDGSAYTEDSWRQFMQNGLRRSLGYPIGPHALRRFCATLRYVYGWSAEEAAQHLDDTEAVVRKSYIDEGYVRKVGRRSAAPGERPALPQVWQIVKGLRVENDS